MKSYFVILNTQYNPAPLTNEYLEMLFFDTFKKAEDAADSSFFGSSFGYEIFCLGEGVFC